MASEYLETTVDKFVFRVETDRRYSEDGLWVRLEDGLARVGVSDYVQQTSGDVALAEIEPAGTELARGDTLGMIETIKTAVDLLCPVSGTVREANPELESSPELINQDPYGRGWLASIAPRDWESERAELLEPEQYLAAMRRQAEEASRQR